MRYNTLLCFSISIHASRGGSDFLRLLGEKFYFDFNPRFPWGKRPQSRNVRSIWSQFQSTLPVGEATYSLPFGSPTALISIHASRGGSDLSILTQSPMTFLFQSTLPVGEATLDPEYVENLKKISIHASRGGSDPHSAGQRGSHRHFNPRFPWGKRLCC